MSQALWDAVYNEDIEELRRILPVSFDFSLQGSNGHTLLMQAAEMENEEIAAFLLAKGADINVQGHDIGLFCK